MPRPRKRRRREVTRVPRSEARLPEVDRRACPKGLVTRRQLREKGLSPGGHGPVAVLRCKACAYRPQWLCIHPTRAWLYRVDLARPKRKPSLAQEEALDRAMAARQTCPVCGRRYHHCLPLKSLGSCLECFDGTPAAPDSYCLPVSAGHLLAA
ncbi:RRQRL motif-containing zinc-binding protein [Streptomyces rimosus]|uniref:RRQRL motif-containing zinc-binding protein n=1 Tax=Streptomyces rimosus TaxID=1927 RepID=UPI0004C78657|nr:RRQRL motif-containing zinc-binding protein [Streptomyces rimosus]